MLAGRRVQFLGIGLAIGRSQSHLKGSALLSGYLVPGRVPANYYMPYGGRAAICNVPVEWPAMSGRCLADFTAGRRPASERRLTDIWIVWVVQNLARHPPDVCDALPDIGQASTDLLAIRLRWETPQCVLRCVNIYLELKYHCQRV